MDYGDESRQMPPKEGNNKVFRIIITVLILSILIGFFIFIIVKTKPFSDLYDEVENRQEIVVKQLKLVNETKRLLNSNDIIIDKGEVYAFMCSGSSDYKMILFTNFILDYNNIIIVYELVFEEVVPKDYESMVDTFITKPYTYNKIYSAQVRETNGLDIISYCSIEYENTNGFISKNDHLECFKSCFNRKYSAIKQTSTYTVLIFAYVEKDNKKEFVALEYVIVIPDTEFDISKCISFDHTNTYKIPNNVIEGINYANIYLEFNESRRR